MKQFLIIALSLFFTYSLASAFLPEKNSLIEIKKELKVDE